MVSRNVQEGYGNASHAFTTDAATEHLERNLKTNSVNKREIHKVGSFQEIKSENDILLLSELYNYPSYSLSRKFPQFLHH